MVSNSCSGSRWLPLTVQRISTAFWLGTRFLSRQQLVVGDLDCFLHSLLFLVVPHQLQEQGGERSYGSQGYTLGSPPRNSTKLDNEGVANH